MIAAVGSRKQPTNSISRLAISRNSHGSLVTPSTHSAICAVTPVAVSIQPKIDAAATMNITVAVVSTESRLTLTNIFQFIVRYQTRPRNIAHALAAIAPSVGVNRPVVMPPISSTGVMIGSTAWKRKMRSSTNSETIAPNTTGCAGRPILLTSAQAPSGQAITIASSISARPKRLPENLTSPPQPFLCAKYATVTIISSAISTPGRMPARNSAPTETLAIIA